MDNEPINRRKQQHIYLLRLFLLLKTLISDMFYYLLIKKSAHLSKWLLFDVVMMFEEGMKDES